MGRVWSFRDYLGVSFYSIFISWRDLGVLWGSSVDGRGMWLGKGLFRVWLLREMKVKLGKYSLGLVGVTREVRGRFEWNLGKVVFLKEFER